MAVGIKDLKHLLPRLSEGCAVEFDGQKDWLKDGEKRNRVANPQKGDWRFRTPLEIDVHDGTRFNTFQVCATDLSDSFIVGIGNEIAVERLLELKYTFQG